MITRIGINALGPISKDTGGRTYLINLSKQLTSLIKDDEIIFFVSPGESDILSSGHPNIQLISIPNSISTFQRLRCEHFVLPNYIRKNHIQAMYYPGNFASWHCPVPYVLAIRSMLVYNRPDDSSVSGMKRLYRRTMLPRSAHHAKQIITPSLHTKEEISKFIGVKPDKINVIPHGIDLSLFSQTSNPIISQPLLSRLQIQRPYLLYVSALWEYKNHDKLILAFHQLVQKYQVPHQLVLIGQGMNSFEGYSNIIRNLIKECRLENRIRIIDFLPHEELVHVYQNADVFVFPSMTESFGNPLFEAMASRVPVVCSNAHAMTDLTGEAALTVNPMNIDEFSHALFQIINDQNLKKSLIEKGLQKTQTMTWPRCARETLNLIKQSIE